MTKICVEYSGYCVIDPSNIKFVCVGSDLPDIDGFEWLGLSLEDRQNYVVDSLIDIQSECEDGIYEDIDITPYTPTT